jgi:exopolysaccharide production protein ExoY
MANLGNVSERLAPIENAVKTPIGGHTKRILDIIFSLALIFFSIPLLILTWTAIRVFEGGPVLVRHPRVGLGGEEFQCVKFRTMRTDGDRVLSEFLAQNPFAAQEWEERRKLDHDPRVTPLGALLRKSSIDELPQLFNILSGSMSLVGPRPITKAELPRYGSAAKEYLMTRPGLTGLWQVSGRNRLSYAKRVELDQAYVQNWKLTDDVVILLKTIPAMADTGSTS